MRYPPHLLQEVVDTLSDAEGHAVAAAPDVAPGAAPQQQQHPAAAQAGAHVEGQLGQQALGAAAMGAVRQVRLASPAGTASVARALRRQPATGEGVPDMASRYLSCLGMGLKRSPQIAVKDEEVVQLDEEAGRLGAKRPRQTPTGVLGQLQVFIFTVML